MRHPFHASFSPKEFHFTRPPSTPARVHMTHPPPLHVSSGQRRRPQVGPLNRSGAREAGKNTARTARDSNFFFWWWFCFAGTGRARCRCRWVGYGIKLFSCAAEGLGLPGPERGTHEETVVLIRQGSHVDCWSYLQFTANARVTLLLR
ncbi:hypothetical protein BU26DRAFT_86880 [Trematosphaeria pertusa]|uniref:Uncharacterized protein n=1 Tax=Trematosphaeria pertusa TaxID=390896 RepID=A0A6A6I4C7_9PLEO|nr:uncharacterized protein BU26DRAFT_86880 [Trematosphaeria pertusa]KAF2244802.1 hypothetical protein BU26DRAFT_86880 [Trematosphaeria pertusa]